MEDTVKKVLIIDDNTAIHDDFRKILNSSQPDLAFNESLGLVFGNQAEIPSSGRLNYSIDSAYQGQEALDKIKQSITSNQPYALAFVDIRMPPGWDGIKTVQEIWKIDPNIQIVICTAYSDYSWKKMSEIFKQSDNFLILKKPFESIEICQLTAALTKKWELRNQVKYQIENLEKIVSERTADLLHQATHDSLTGLPNRILLMDRIQQSIMYAKRRGFFVGVLMLDLDNFKQVNDTLGHYTGDELLKLVSKRLCVSVRESDTISRLGGDEFVVLLPSQKHISDLTTKAEQLVDVCSPPYQIENHKITSTVSIGMAIYPKDGQDAETLLKNADIALFRAKDAGRNNYQIYTAEFGQFIEKKTSLTVALRSALKQHELILHYQPLLKLKSGKITGVEALLRWNHPTLGLIQPNSFIALAEESGLIVSIGEWVLRTACLQALEWQNTINPELHVAVNVSVYQFREKDFVSKVQTILEETGINPSRLELEITESVILGNVSDAYNKMNELKKMGIHLSVDDFGTGYSSLSYLKYFPFDKVKIDKSFIDGITNNNEDKSIVEAIIAMTAMMGLEVLAEGVEREDQVKMLQNLQGNQIQGYYFSHPLDVQACTQLLKQKS